jgi:putative oxidoreductase
LCRSDVPTCVLCNMVVAVSLIHHKFGLFMNWGGDQKGEGFEYHLLAIAVMLAIIIKGAGAYSLDYMLSRTSQIQAATTGSAR